ncbi:hypothetical protein ACROYT_G037067 [Oculina patagonica]
MMNTVVGVLLMLQHSVRSGLADNCFANPVGISDEFKIPDDRLTASSYYDDGYQPAYGRLNGTRGDGWCAKESTRYDDWIQVDLGKTIKVCGAATQGDINANEWTTAFKLSYSSDGNTWATYSDANGTEMEFQRQGRGNTTDQHKLPVPVSARYFRFNPTDNEGWNCLRVELYSTEPLGENGGYSKWSPWTRCSATCGDGVRFRNRSCTNPPPGPYHKDCSHLGSNNQTVECSNVKDCPHRRNNTQKAECNNSSCTVTDVLKSTHKESSLKNTLVYVFTSFGILVILVLLTGLLKYTRFWRKSIPSPPEFKYHAFIIYNQEDSHWVNGKLLPFLEEKHHLKCCIHYRDFAPGKPFTESMAESVYNSHKIIAVLSSHFLKSNYCSYELNIAKYRLLNKKDDSLIIIRIDKEDCRKLPRELRKRNFIDYSNSLERPLWESKLLRFLNVQDYSINQDVAVKQILCNNTNINHFAFISNGKSAKNEGDITTIATKNNIMIINMEQETVL